MRSWAQIRTIAPGIFSGVPNLYQIPRHIYFQIALNRAFFEDQDRPITSDSRTCFLEAVTDLPELADTSQLKSIQT